MKSHNLIVLATFAMATLPSPAATLDFSYNFDNATPHGFGYGKAETYNVAMLLDQPSLVGRRVTKMSVPLSQGASDCSAWLTKTLKLKTQGGVKVNSADVCTVAGQVQDGVLSVDFGADGYEIPEQGMYVGYTFTIADPAADPEPVSVIDYEGTDALWVAATTSQLKYTDAGKRNNAASAMTVTLVGDFPTNAATVTLPPYVYAMRGEDATISAKITNMCALPISEIAYTYTMDGLTHSETYALSEPIPGNIARNRTIELPLRGVETLGDYDLTFNLTQVNGTANEVDGSATSQMRVRTFLPKHKPLVDEFTGLLCAWCPRGYVAMESLARDHGSEFVGMAWHHPNFETDAMEVYSPYDYPVMVSSLPCASVDRGSTIDPSDIRARWDAAYGTLAAGSVDVSLTWSDDAHTMLKAKATARFLDSDNNAGYRLAFALVADSLHNDMWAQKNAYAPEYSASRPEGADYSDPLWDLFLNKENYVMGLKFNHVVAYFPDNRGIEGSLPTHIEAGEEYAAEFNVNTADVLNHEHHPFVNDFGYTRVIAIILDKAGNVVNCATSQYPAQPVAVENVWQSDTEDQPTYYDLLGRPVAAPAHGVYVRVAGGKTSKIMLKCQ